MASSAVAVVQQKKNVLKTFVVLTTAFLDNTKRKYFNFTNENCGVSQAVLSTKIRLVVDGSEEYVKVFEDLCWIGYNEERMKRMKAQVLCGDFGELTDFIRQLSYFLEKSQESYGGVKKAIDGLLSRTKTAAQHFRNLERKEKRKKNTTRAVGGSVATGAVAVGAAGGVTLSVVAGVFTFGVGTIVGLSITAIATAVAGAGIATGTGVATHCIASSFAESEKECMELSQSCSKLLSAAEEMEEFIGSIRVAVKLISTNLELVQKTKASHNDHRSLVAALKCLWKRFDGYNPAKFDTLKNDLSTKRNDFLPNHRH